MSCSRPPVAFDVLQQLVGRGLVGGVRARVDVADAAPRLQADVPDPAAALRGGDGLAGDLLPRVGVRHLQRDRPVVEQDVLLRLDLDAVVLADQQRAHAGAVDEQVAFDRAVVARLQRGDVAVVVRVDAGHVVADMAHAEAFDAVLAHEHAELAGIEVVGVVGHRRPFRRGELLGRLAGLAQVRLEADQLAERHLRVLHPAGDDVRLQVALRQHERMVVVVVVAVVRSSGRTSSPA